MLQYLLGRDHMKTSCSAWVLIISSRTSLLFIEQSPILLLPQVLVATDVAARGLDIK